MYSLSQPQYMVALSVLMSRQGNYRFGTQPLMFSAKSKKANFGALANNEGEFFAAGETTKSAQEIVNQVAFGCNPSIGFDSF